MSSVLTRASSARAASKIADLLDPRATRVDDRSTATRSRMAWIRASATARAESANRGRSGSRSLGRRPACCTAAASMSSSPSASSGPSHRRNRFGRIIRRASPRHACTRSAPGEMPAARRLLRPARTHGPTCRTRRAARRAAASNKRVDASQRNMPDRAPRLGAVHGREPLAVGPTLAPASNEHNETEPARIAPAQSGTS